LVTGILVHGILQLGSVPLTFDASRTLAVGIFSVPGRDAARTAQLFESILEQSQALPGVEAATLADQDPMDNSNSEPIELQDSAGPVRAGRLVVYRQVVSANFFDALNAPVKQGRGFTPADRAGSEPVALVNESLARQCWPGASPVGKRFRVSGGDPGKWLTVAGVVPDLPMQGALNTGSPAGFYRPASQQPLSGAVLILRSRIDPHSLVAPLRMIIRRLDPDLPLDSIFTVEELRDRKLATPRAFGGLAAAFALSALILAAVGIYGVTGFAVQRRTREFGIRLALGARPADLSRLVLGRGLIHAGLSLGAGAAAGWALSRPMVASMREMIGAATPYTYVFVFGTLTAAVLLALWVPARKASRVDPAITLRAD
jgi:predicted permease